MAHEADSSGLVKSSMQILMDFTQLRILVFLMLTVLARTFFQGVVSKANLHLPC